MAARVGIDDFEEKVLKSSIPVVVDFYSDSCIACKKLAPVLGNIEDDYEGKISVVKVNTSFDTELSERYGIMSNPTIIIFADGDEKARKVGAQSYDDLDEWIAQYV